MDSFFFFCQNAKKKMKLLMVGRLVGYFSVWIEYSNLVKRVFFCFPFHSSKIHPRILFLIFIYTELGWLRVFLTWILQFCFFFLTLFSSWQLTAFFSLLPFIQSALRSSSSSTKQHFEHFVVSSILTPSVIFFKLWKFQCFFFYLQITYVIIVILMMMMMIRNSLEINFLGKYFQDFFFFLSQKTTSIMMMMMIEKNLPIICHRITTKNWLTIILDA